MQTYENLIRQVKKMFEQKTGWGNNEDWTNQDFLQLSELIRDQTGVTISHVTLKRIWGKVKYESLPNTHTLNILAQYLGYEHWRDLAVKNQPSSTPPASSSPSPTNPSIPSTNPSIPSINPSIPSIKPQKPKSRRRIWLYFAPLLIVLLVLLFLHGQQSAPRPQDYAFTSKKVVTSGLPNSVIFDYDATRSPDDSVIIQQSWDTTRRVKVPKDGHQYTSIYYYPDFYHATLQVRDRVVKSHNLLIKSDGWLPLVEQSPVPVYFKKEETIHDGKLGISLDEIRRKNIPLQPSPPTVLYSNVRDFGEIYSDHFVFETSIKNDFSEGSAACQLTRVYLLCEGTAIWIPLCAKGCVSNVDLYFTYFYTSGKREDLSAFGVNFNDYVKLRIESDSGRARILINDRLVYTVPRHIRRSKIIGIDFSFQGTGSVDYVSLSNGKISYRDDFNFPDEPAPSARTPLSSISSRQSRRASPI